MITDIVSATYNNKKQEKESENKMSSNQELTRYMRKKGTRDIFYVFNDNPLVLEQCEVVPYGYDPAHNPEHVALLWKYGKVIGNEIIITPEVIHPDDADAESLDTVGALPDKTEEQIEIIKEESQEEEVEFEESGRSEVNQEERVVTVDDPLWEFSRKELLIACDKLNINHKDTDAKAKLIKSINTYYDFDKEKLDIELNKIRDTLNEKV